MNNTHIWEYFPYKNTKKTHPEIFGVYDPCLYLAGQILPVGVVKRPPGSLVSTVTFQINLGVI